MGDEAALAGWMGAVYRVRLGNGLGGVAGLDYLFVMTETETSLLRTLRELEDSVAAMRTANPKPDLLPLFARIDALTDQLPRQTDPQLLHYLRKKSYEKARLFLQGRDTENQTGNCRHD